MIRAEVCRIGGAWRVDILTFPRRDDGPIVERWEPPLRADTFSTHAEALAWAIDQTKGQDR